jgi:hypothetical protein
MRLDSKSFGFVGHRRTGPSGGRLTRVRPGGGGP